MHCQGRAYRTKIFLDLWRLASPLRSAADAVDSANAASQRQLSLKRPNWSARCNCSGRRPQRADHLVLQIRSCAGHPPSHFIPAVCGPADVHIEVFAADARGALIVELFAAGFQLDQASGNASAERLWHPGPQIGIDVNDHCRRGDWLSRCNVLIVLLLDLVMPQGQRTANLSR